MVKIRSSKQFSTKCGIKGFLNIHKLLIQLNLPKIAEVNKYIDTIAHTQKKEKNQKCNVFIKSIRTFTFHS